MPWIRLVLASLVWHEMAHVNRLDERAALEQEEALWRGSYRPDSWTVEWARPTSPAYEKSAPGRRILNEVHRGAGAAGIDVCPSS